MSLGLRATYITFGGSLLCVFALPVLVYMYKMHKSLELIMYVYIYIRL